MPTEQVTQEGREPRNIPVVVEAVVAPGEGEGGRAMGWTTPQAEAVAERGGGVGTGRRGWGKRGQDSRRCVTQRLACIPSG